MSDTETPETTEAPKTGPDAASAVMAAHWAKKEAAQPPADEETDDQEEEKAQPQQPPKKRAGLVKALREERAARKATEGQMAQLQAQIDELKKSGATQTGGVDLKTDPIGALIEAGHDEAAILDQLQKRAIENGGLSPAMQKVVDKIRKDNDELRAKLAKLDEGIASKADEQANAAGWAALRAESQKLDAYPELKGYDWAELEEPIAGALQYLASKGHETVKPEEVLGLLNQAFKNDREAKMKRWGLSAQEQPPPPAKKPAAPPAKAAKKPADDEGELPPVEPTDTRRKARLPTDKEVERRIARRLAQR